MSPLDFVVLAADLPGSITYGAVAMLLVVILLVFLWIALTYGNLWFQAYMSNAQVSLLRLVAMSFRQVNARVIVQSKIMAMQAGIGNDPSAGITTQRLEAHYLAGGNVPGVIKRDHRRPSRRHRSRFRSRRGHRPGRPRRAGRRADERQSESDRLPRSAEIEEVDAQRHRQATASSCRFGPASRSAPTSSS